MREGNRSSCLHSLKLFTKCSQEADIWQRILRWNNAWAYALPRSKTYSRKQTMCSFAKQSSCLHFSTLCLLLECLRRSPSMWHEAGTWCPISSTAGNNHVSTFSNIRNAGETCMKPGPDLGRTGPESLAAWWTDFSLGFWFELVSRVSLVWLEVVLLHLGSNVWRDMIAFIKGN